MANPLFKALGGSMVQRGGKRNFAPDLIRHIHGFQGNPIQQLQGKLNSGEMTQEQYNQLHNAAENIVSQMMGVLKR